jgi:hypothetical protein
VALVNRATLAVVDSHTGQVIRPLSPYGSCASATGSPESSACRRAAAEGTPDSGWSPDDGCVYMGDFSGGIVGFPAPGQTEFVVMNAKTDVVLLAPRTSTGCAGAGMALSDTELFTAEYCPTLGGDRIGRYQLAAGAPETSVALPRTRCPQGPLAVDPSGRHLIASLVPAAIPCTPLNVGCFSQEAGDLGTEQGGVWTQLPALMADNFRRPPGTGPHGQPLR